MEEITSHVLQHPDDLIDEDRTAENVMNIKKDYNQKLADRKLGKDEFCLGYQTAHVKLGIWGHYKPDVYRHKPIDFYELDITGELPRTMMSFSNIMRAVWTNYDSISGDIYTPYRVLGGIVNICLYTFPDPPKLGKGWKMRKMATQEEVLTKNPYPNETSGVNATPVKTTFVLPPYVYVHEEDVIRVGYWDEGKWTTDSIDNLKYEPETRTLSFATPKIAPLAFLQDRAVDYPYQGWSLRSVASNEAIFDLEGKRLSLKFKIGAGYVELLNRDEPELAHLKGVRVAPGVLLQRLARCGINLMPDDEDIQFTEGYELKDDDCFERAIMDISLSIRSFAFRHSKWNKTLPKNQAITRIRENLEFDEEFHEDEEIHWKTVIWENNKCYLCYAKESADECDSAIPEDIETHSTMQKLMETLHSMHGELMCTEEAHRRLSELYEMEYMETVRKFLRILKLLRFQ